MGRLAELGGTTTDQMLQATVELEDGEEQLVILGAPSAEAVPVTGRVTSRGEPAGGRQTRCRFRRCAGRTPYAPATPTATGLSSGPRAA